MEPRVGEKYRIWIDGEPVPKSTMTPPVIRKRMSAQARAYVVKSIINRDPKYAPLKKTQEYQYFVATEVWNALEEFPQFDQQDPIKLTVTFYKGKHSIGDLKNLIAAIEDGIQHSARIPNDRQITSYGECRIFFFSDNPGVEVIAEIDPFVHNEQWLRDWLNTSETKFRQYVKMREIDFG